MMTKEEIIIDGINVNECSYFIDHTPPKGQGDWCGAIHKGACKVYSKDCEYNKNCYFKQLKRLQEENKELKKVKDDFFKQAEISHQAVQDKNKIIEKLEQENEKLIEINDDTKDRYCDLYENADKLANKFYKYKQALEEIRNKLKPLKDYDIVAEIQNRIDEVLNDRD